MSNKFKVIAMGRVGTLAINRFINDHPQVSLPSYKLARKKFITQGENIADLFQSGSQQSSHHGIVIHNADFFEKQYRKKLNSMNNIKVEHILHLVRNPFEQVLSWINHINASACIGILEWSKTPRSAEGFYTHHLRHFQTIQSGLQCRTFYKNFKRVKTIDFPELMPSKVEQTMKGIYDFLGVDNSHTSQIFRQPQNNYTLELLREGITFKLNNEIIEMIMIPENVFFHYEKETQPWVTIHDTDYIYQHCPSLPRLEGDLIFLPKSIASHNSLSFKTRKMLHEGIANIVAEVAPVWAKNAEVTAQKIESEKLRTLRPADFDFLQNKLKDDLDVFCRYHPEFKTLWNF